MTERAFAPDDFVGVKGSISDRYIIPPFSVLDTRLGSWKARRRWWLSLGIQSELGRGKDLAFNLNAGSGIRGWGGTTTDAEGVPVWSRREADERAGSVRKYGRAEMPEWADGNGTRDYVQATSIFDPVLAEMMYRWFAPPGGHVLDPFAGGSVRGIVAAMLGHPYTGVDLSAEQCEANREQGERIVPALVPTWLTGDSRAVLPTLDGGSYDMVMTCPPYYDLEVYSDDPRDVSAMGSYDEFLEAYRAILAEAVRCLRPGRFAVVVVSEVRDKRGRYRGLVPDTIAALTDAGASCYNEAILINAAGTLPMRVEKQFGPTRKLGRMHQNILVAVKGEPERGWDADRVGPPDPQMSLFG